MIAVWSLAGGSGIIVRILVRAGAGICWCGYLNPIKAVEGDDVGGDGLSACRE